MSVVITDEILQTMHLSSQEFCQEMALLFYQQKRLTLAQASAFAGMDRLSFQQMLSHRQIPIHYDEEDLLTDLATLKKLNLA
ncbi:MAG: UPF0175 family protein [Chloroflexaceae bacterium]|nr:UPF0175 family protein [Chloroflexaceae bacterium]